MKENFNFLQVESPDSKNNEKISQKEQLQNISRQQIEKLQNDVELLNSKEKIFEFFQNFNAIRLEEYERFIGALFKQIDTKELKIWDNNSIFAMTEKVLEGFQEIKDTPEEIIKYFQFNNLSELKNRISTFWDFSNFPKINELITKKNLNHQEQQKIIAIFLTLDYFSQIDQMITVLPKSMQTEAQEILYQTKSINENTRDYVNFFNKNPYIFLQIEWINSDYYNSVDEYDKNFPEKETFLKEFLPHNENIAKLLAENKIEDKKISVKYFKKNGSNPSQANPINNQMMQVFPENIPDFKKYSPEEQKRILDGSLANESMHIFLKTIWFGSNKSTVIFANLDNQIEEITYNQAHELLSDFASTQFMTESEWKRLVMVALIWILRLHDEWGGYEYLWKFYKKEVENFLWKNINNIFDEVDFSWKSLVEIANSDIFKNKINELYAVLISSNKDWQNWLEFLQKRIQEQSEKILSQIYSNFHEK